MNRLNTAGKLTGQTRRDELIDRYGEPPKAVTDLINIAFLKNRAATLGITEISEQDGRLLLYCAALTEEVSKLLTSPIKRRVMFSAGKRAYVSIRPEPRQSILDTLKEVLNIMQP